MMGPLSPLGKATGIVRDYVFGLYYIVDEVPRIERLLFAPPLLLVEYLVYRVDALAERNVRVDLEIQRSDDYEKFFYYKRLFVRLLRTINVWNAEIEKRIEDGENFVRLENKTTSRTDATPDEVLALVELRPTDVRLLHAMIFALRRRSVDAASLALLWPVEVLADIDNDLQHYTADVRSGTLNVYDTFIRRYGDGAAAELRHEVSRYEAMVVERLLDVPVHRRDRVAKACRRRYSRALSEYPQPLERAVVQAHSPKR